MHNNDRDGCYLTLPIDPRIKEALQPHHQPVITKLLAEVAADSLTAGRRASLINEAHEADRDAEITLDSYLTETVLGEYAEHMTTIGYLEQHFKRPPKIRDVLVLQVPAQAGANIGETSCTLRALTIALQELCKALLDQQVDL